MCISAVDSPVVCRCPGDSGSAKSTVSSVPWEDCHVLRLKLDLPHSLRHNGHPDSSVRKSYGSYLTPQVPNQSGWIIALVCGREMETDVRDLLGRCYGQVSWQSLLQQCLILITMQCNPTSVRFCVIWEVVWLKLWGCVTEMVLLRLVWGLGLCNWRVTAVLYDKGCCFWGCVEVCIPAATEWIGFIPADVRHMLDEKCWSSSGEQLWKWRL